MARASASASASQGSASTTTSSTQFAFNELGASGLRQFSGYVREEWLRELTGWRGMRIYREMEDNDPVIGAFMFSIEMLLRTVQFSIEPASQSPHDLECAQFIDSCITDMEQSWPEFISEVLSFLVFGWSVHETVYKMRKGKSKNPKFNSRFDDGLIGWRKFAGRAQETLLHWEFDESGDAIALIQLLPTGGPLLRVPLAKCLHFRTRLRKNNPEGKSILRTAYTSYFKKKRVEELELIGMERDLTGLIVAEIPGRLLDPNASPDDQAQLASIKKIVVETYRNEQEGIVWPLVYDQKDRPMYNLKLLTTGGRRQFDTTQIADRYAKRIAMCVLADFLMLGLSEGGRGSYAMAKNKSDMFSVAIIGFLDMIAAEFNRNAIPTLLDMNGMEGRCIMQHGEISQRDILEFGQAVAALANVGLITPDAQTEAKVREEVGLPPQEGNPLDDIDVGGAAEADGELSGSRTVSTDPAMAQGRGQPAGASDPSTQVIVPVKKTVGGRTYWSFKKIKPNGDGRVEA